MAPGASPDKGSEVRADGVQEEKAAGREEKATDRVGETAIAQEIVVEAEAKRIEVKSGEARRADSNEEPPAAPAEDAAGAAAQKSGAAVKEGDLEARGGRSSETKLVIKETSAAAGLPDEAKDADEAAESMKVEGKKMAPSFALSVNPPSDGLDSLLAALEGTGREIGAFAVKIGGRVVPERETAAVKTSIRPAMSDRRTIRPLTVVIPADSLQIFLGEIERLGKTRTIGASIVSQEGDSATVRVELN
jgi:hypothetical protein